MKRNRKIQLLVLLLALLALAFTACSYTARNAVADEPLTELILLPNDAAPDDVTSPADETDGTEAQAPPDAAPGDIVSPAGETDRTDAQEPPAAALNEDGSYDSKEDVALYLHLYGHLPDNYITKKEAEALGWTGGSLEPYAPGKCIGGSRFGNYEGLLPAADGRKYTECDIDTLGKSSRGAKRIVFSNDGLIYYTGDHYASFELLYGEE